MRQHRDLYPIYLSSWLERKIRHRNWFGLRDTLDRCLKITEDRSAFTMVSWTAGAQRPQEFFDEEIKFIGGLDFAKLIGWEPLKGLKAG
jgi:hypothetical protein